MQYLKYSNENYTYYSAYILSQLNVLGTFKKDSTRLIAISFWNKCICLKSQRFISINLQNGIFWAIIYIKS